ncbi:hypothetical protein [Paraburkholderia silvatlantica]|uniref:hypothetical protein n=1 Tax=Paraburkholderia silvatlantica TaxID=321895 RepID=UPI001FCFF874|nr:hypothetical protein [Paraburkholderia silvatlantica]
MITQVAAPLKQSMGERQFRTLAAVLQSIEPAFDVEIFLATALDGLESLTLMERIRRASAAIDAGLQACRHCRAVMMPCWRC